MLDFRALEFRCGEGGRLGGWEGERVRGFNNPGYLRRVVLGVLPAGVWWGAGVSSEADRRGKVGNGGGYAGGRDEGRSGGQGGVHVVGRSRCMCCHQEMQHTAHNTTQHNTAMHSVHGFGGAHLENASSAVMQALVHSTYE